MKRPSTHPHDIAVIGLAGRFPGAPDINIYWNNLKQGIESITFFTDEELEKAGISPTLIQDPRYVKAKGHLAESDRFDGEFFGYPPKQVERMDPQIRLLHETTWHALESAGYIPDEYPGRVGAYFGALDNLEWIRAIGGRLDEDMELFLLNFRDYVSTRISFKLNLRGPSFTLLSACSTSLVAIHLACQALRLGECEAAVAGGVSVTYPEKNGYLYHEGLLLSSDGHCRTFDAQADGTVFGDGVGVLVLKRYKDAIADGDPIRAVIKGSAVNNDGRNKIGFTAPSIEGQRQVIAAALQSAGVCADSIQMVEAHGTGTLLGDPIEVEALHQGYRTEKKGIIALGSVKTNIGHTNIAAGAAAIIKCILSLENGQIPPSLHYSAPNPGIDFSTGPFYVNTMLRPWPETQGPRRAGVSAFGFGGTNAHFILQAPPPVKEKPKKKVEALLLLSAKNRTSLDETARGLARHLENNPDINLRQMAFTLATGRKNLSYRRAITAGSPTQAIEKLRSPEAATHLDKKIDEVIFMFPGQGAQYINMGRGLYRSESVFRSQFDRCAEILLDHMGLDIRDILFLRGINQKEANRQLTRTALAQPAIFCVSHALAELLKSWGIRPSGFIGHSLGEFVAASQAGVFSLEDALFLVSRRGVLMQSVTPGAMLAVPLSETDLTPWLDDRHALAAVNAPELCVVSAPYEAIEDLKRRLTEARIASQPLITSHAFHSPMMEPALGPFREMAQSIPMKAPAVPIMSTVTGDWARDDEICTIDYWVKNLRQTVRFSTGVQKILDQKEAALLEVGPGRALSSLTRMHPHTQRPVLPTLPGPRENRTDRAVLLDALGKLWCAGLPIDWPAFYGPAKPARLPLPGYPFTRQAYRRPATPRATPAPSWLQLNKITDMNAWFSVPSWKRSLQVRLELGDQTTRLTWLLFIDPEGLGERVARRLEAYTQEVIRVAAGDRYEMLPDDRFIIRPGERNDYDRLFTELSSRNKPPRHILHLWTLTPPEMTAIPLDQTESFQIKAFFSLLFLAQVLGNQTLSPEMRISVITNRAWTVCGQEPIIPDKATVLGPLKVIPQEFPTLDTCLLDVEFTGSEENPDLPDRILTEVVTNQSEPVVAFRGDYRWIQHFEPVHLEPAPQEKRWLRPRGCYLITGGLGGIGLVLARHLAKTVQARLILTGRSPLPKRETWREILGQTEGDEPQKRRIRSVQELEGLGAEVFFLTADVTDMTAMTDGLTRARAAFGPVHGIIHAAGMPGEGVISLKQVEEARRVLSPKIHGTLVLDHLFREEKPDFMLLCSSIAAILGGIGLVDYCAANAYQDAFACASHPYPVYAVNWDMWGETGMGLKTRMPQELQSWLEKELRDGITNEEGVAVFERILYQGHSPNTIVSTRSLPARLDMWIRRELIKQKAAMVEDEEVEPSYQRPELASDFVAPLGETEERIAAIWSRLFGIARVGRHDNFYELGGHSLLATTLVSKLKREFDRPILIRDIQDHPTVASIAKLITDGAMDP
jgi:acyl transferase domain-containing protein/acyl carrier protein